MIQQSLTFVSLFLASLKYLTVPSPPPVTKSNNVSSVAHITSGSKHVIVQMFEWTWDSIASECTNFIGPAGYGYVKLSPAQEHIAGNQWWTDYQPVSYILTSKHGNRDQLSNMIRTCHAAGVKVIADTIFNHMAGIPFGLGVAGSFYTHHFYPGIYRAQDFHYCGLVPNNNIINHYNRVEVQACQYLNLADLATDTNEHVRSRLAEYGNDLLSLGINGMHLSASKYMAAADIANITSRFTSSPYIIQDVNWGSGEPIQPSEYIRNGHVQEFRYTTALMNAFLSGDISGLKNFDDRGWVPSTKANVFVTNHDTERINTSLNKNSPSNTYITAMIFSLAHPYGNPTILSSYEGFTNFNKGAPNSGVGTCTKTGGKNGWLCQHRWVAISGMTGFRNTVGAEPIANWVSPQSDRIAFGRGSSGFVAINNNDSAWKTTFTTSLPDGTYCDVIRGTKSSGSCTGPSFSVFRGSLTAIVPPRSAIAAHTGSTSTGN